MEGNFFTLTPMTQRMSDLKPGQSYTGSITIINPINATSDFHYSVQIAPYSVSGEGYDADFSSSSDYTLLANWLTIDDPTGVITPNHTKTVHYTIKVPSNAPAGGQYAAIVVSKDPDATTDEDSGVAIKDIHEIASLIYADVAGQTTRSGEILENNFPTFVTSAPITLSAMLTNTGNIHITATIAVEATDAFTGEVIVGPSKENYQYAELIMPETTRYATRNISENLPQLGIVHVSQTIQYNGQTSVTEHDVIICPVWFLILICFIFFLLILSIFHLFHKFYCRKKHAHKTSKLKQ